MANTHTNRKVKILFLTDDREDYLADGVLHGLRQIGSTDVIDFPRKACLYQDNSSKSEFSVRGGGFTLYGLLREEDSYGQERMHIQQKLENGYFDLVVLSNIWRQWGLLIQWESLLKDSCKLAILDGDDDERFYPSSRTRLKHFGPSRWLRKLLSQKTTVYFKRELTNKTNQWPYTCCIKTLSFSIPKEKIIDLASHKSRLLPSHIVDQEVADLMGSQTGYAFSTEAEYRQNLAESRFGITTKRGGWECLRHYEIAASATIPCFKDLTSKPESCAPHGLVDGFNCISYNSTQDLMEQINQLSRPAELAMREAALDWAKASSTKIRAMELLQAMKIDP